MLSTESGAVALSTVMSAAGSGSDDITLHVGRTGPGSGKVLIGIALQAPAGSVGPVGMVMTPQGRPSGQVVFQQEYPADGMTDVVMARVSPGTYDLQATMTGASGPMAMDAYLVGDVNGDGRVNAQDIRQMRKDRGAASGGELAADPTGAGLIDAQDMQLARSNLGASATIQVQPLALTAALDPSSDPAGAGVVMGPVVIISGATEPGATVLVDPGDTGQFTQSTTADAKGDYQFSASIGLGKTTFRVMAIDAAGAQANADVTVTRGDAVIAWNQTMLDAIRRTKDSLGLSTRTMAMVQAAVYDAVNDVDHFGSVFKVGVTAAPGSSDVASASEAAYDILAAEIPQEQSLYDAMLAESKAQVADASAWAGGAAVGDAVAQGILAWRAGDQSGDQVPYVPGTSPGQWRPTPPDYSIAWGPEWGQVATFAIPSASAFLPGPPPALNSPAYAAALRQVESLGAADSKTRTPEETQIADFWAYDTAGVGPPPVMFNQITQDLALQQHNTLDQDARLFGLVDVAMGDAGIVAWDVKYTYSRWRPITAIREAASDGNPMTVADPTWTPLGSPGDGYRANYTPNFPSYMSGHATFGGALFSILAGFYGTDTMTFTIGSDEEPGVTRTYHSFSAADQELDNSRIYLGIHFSFDETAGQASGSAIGNYVLKNVMTTND